MEDITMAFIHHAESHFIRHHFVEPWVAFRTNLEAVGRTQSAVRRSKFHWRGPSFGTITFISEACVSADIEVEAIITFATKDVRVIRTINTARTSAVCASAFIVLAFIVFQVVAGAARTTERFRVRLLLANMRASSKRFTTRARRAII
jgi:hypothetical protein